MKSSAQRRLWVNISPGAPRAEVVEEEEPTITTKRRKRKRRRTKITMIPWTCGRGASPSLINIDTNTNTNSGGNLQRRIVVNNLSNNNNRADNLGSPS